MKAGDRVRCINRLGAEDWLEAGRIYVVEVFNPRGMGGIGVVQLEGVMNGWKANRFELVQDEPKPIAQFQVGDKVKIVAKVEHTPDGRNCGWVADMVKYLNDGQEYEIDSVWDGCLCINFPNGESWSFLPECLQHVEEEVEWVVVDRAPVAGDFVLATKDAHNGKFKKGSIHEVTRAIPYDLSFLIDLADPLNLGMQGWRYERYFEVVEKGQAMAKKEVKKVVKKKKPVKKKPINLRAELLKNQKHKDFTSSFAIMRASGEILWHTNAWCHAQIRQGNKKVIALADNIQNIYSIHKPGSQGVKDYLKYVDYILNRSPWKHCFLPTKAHIALRYGLYMDVSQPIDQIAGALVALREGTEYNHKVGIFLDLVKKGVSEDVAFLVSRFYLKEGKKKEYQFNNGSNHSVLYGSMHKGELFHFIKKGYKDDPDAKPYAEKNSSYTIWTAIAKTNAVPEDKKMYTYLTENAKPQKVGKGWDERLVVTNEVLLSLAQQIEKELKAIK